jgi:GTP cyclohydrolase I
MSTVPDQLPSVANRPHLRLVPQVTIDVDHAERAVRDLLVALGQDITSPHLADTSRRVADAYKNG